MTPEEIAPEVYRLAIAGFVNVYLVGNARGWVFVDTGIPGLFETLKDAAEQQFGAGTRPEAILLTHGHQDHSGSALALAAYWDVPVYAHPMEKPYITGESDYPPLDPTVGGTFAMMARFFPPRNRGYDVGDYYRPLPENGTVPGLGDEWLWLPTPGHAPGQVAFWRERDRTLLAGDAVATLLMDTVVGLVSKKQIMMGPPTPATPDWYAARKSVERLAELKPATVAAGHGDPMFGAAATVGMRNAAQWLRIPQNGRYIAEPAEFDEHGVRYLPPAPKDPLPVMAGIAVAAVAVGLGAWAATRRSRSEKA
jgi:glyoxylase-like metal-dependent hydrolase (beta-lactamase superfamily II)